MITSKHILGLAILFYSFVHPRNFLVQVEGHNMDYNQKYLLPIILDGVSILHWQDTHGNNELITVYSTLSNIAQSKL